jgi:hypothetical protein
MLIARTLQETDFNSRWALNLASACVGLLVLTAGGVALAAEQKQWTVESTTDVTSHNSLYIDASATMSPFGSLYDPGFRIRLTTSFNRYSLTEPQRNASNRSVDVLMGYTHMFEKASVSVGAGPTIASVQESGDTMLNATKVGGKVFMSSYAHPTATTMLYGQLSYSSATQFRLAQTKLGWQVMPGVYAGPEMSVTGGRGFTQARVGAHVTGFSAGMISSGLTIGYVQDSNRGSGYFSSLTLQADM